MKKFPRTRVSALPTHITAPYHTSRIRPFQSLLGHGPHCADTVVAIPIRVRRQAQAAALLIKSAPPPETLGFPPRLRNRWTQLQLQHNQNLSTSFP
ncbi:hypothetical protein BHE90_006256 [Fusarium euwallaceae]|uniref:Uncharacterized protein n=1 Tax=Fusarium euwallaceae TaxID=1147111 RepID=A0A430LU32_9HYPO|nr:hypothetical protein BHE90_006256 [Fusarium euwallaceae]